MTNITPSEKLEPHSSKKLVDKDPIRENSKEMYDNLLLFLEVFRKSPAPMEVHVGMLRAMLKKIEFDMNHTHWWDEKFAEFWEQKASELIISAHDRHTLGRVK